MALQRDKPLVWLNGEVKTPPFSESARLEAGLLLRQSSAEADSGPAAIETHAFGWFAVS